MLPHRALHLPARKCRREDGNTFIVVVVFVAIFSVIIGACYVLSDETNRRTARETQFVSGEVAADAALDVLYGRFAQWINGHTGVTPSATDATSTTTYGSLSFAPITAPISFSTASGLSSYQVTSIALAPLNPDDTDASSTFPNAATYKTSPSTYGTTINKYFSMTPSIYEPQNCAGALTYKATVTVTPVTIDSLHPGAISVSRYFQSSQVSPFSYNIFTEGSFEDYDWGQSFDSEASIYASVKVQMDHKGTIINGPVRYGGSFVDPDGDVNGTSDLVFQDPTTGATVDPYSSGLLRQVSKIEVVPDIVDVIAHNADGTRSASAETATATVDDFSRREIIEPPANLASDTAPDQVAQRRIYTQADLRLKVSVGSKTVTTGKSTSTVTVATGTFYNLDGSILAQYSGALNSGTSTTWTATSGGNSVTGGVIAAVNVNATNSTTPFYDPTRTYDTTTNYSGTAGQPSTSNAGSAIESVDVNVGTLATVINNNQSTFANNTVYVWDDGASGQKNGVRLYDGGVLPTNGLTVGSTNPVYIKGDYNTGTTLTTSTDINSATNSSTLPAADTTGWNGGNMVSASDRVLSGYTAKPSGVFGDTVTTLSQNWRDATSNTGTEYACSTTFNTVMGFGSGDVNSLQPDDSFSSGYYATVQTLEMWNNCRWNQLGEQMALYHSLYNRHRTPPAWVNGGWAVIQNDFDPGTAHLPLRWGYLVFSRGRLTRN